MVRVRTLAKAAKTRLLTHGRLDLWQNLPVLIVVLLGGFISNLAWCVFLNQPESEMQFSEVRLRATA